MNVARKMELLAASLESIITHTDEDGAVRKAVLDNVIASCEAGKARVDAEVAAKIEALTEGA